MHFVASTVLTILNSMLLITVIISPFFDDIQKQRPLEKNNILFVSPSLTPFNLELLPGSPIANTQRKNCTSCRQEDGFFEPNFSIPSTIVWFPEDF